MEADDYRSGLSLPPGQPREASTVCSPVPARSRHEDHEGRASRQGDPSSPSRAQQLTNQTQEVDDVSAHRRVREVVDSDQCRGMGQVFDVQGMPQQMAVRSDGSSKSEKGDVGVVAQDHYGSQPPCSVSSKRRTTYGGRVAAVLLSIAALMGGGTHGIPSHTEAQAQTRAGALVEDRSRSPSPSGSSNPDSPRAYLVTSRDGTQCNSPSQVHRGYRTVPPRDFQIPLNFETSCDEFRSSRGW